MTMANSHPKSALGYGFTVGDGFRLGVGFFLALSSIAIFLCVLYIMFGVSMLAIFTAMDC